MQGDTIRKILLILALLLFIIALIFVILQNTLLKPSPSAPGQTRQPETGQTAPAGVSEEPAEAVSLPNVLSPEEIAKQAAAEDSEPESTEVEETPGPHGTKATFEVTNPPPLE
jgi:hypothetical protein